MVTSSETIVRTKIFQVAAKLLRSRHGGTRLYRSFSIAGGGGTLTPTWAPVYKGAMSDTLTTVLMPK